jgi:hypothetical protein
MSEAPPFLELRGITKRFPGVLALNAKVFPLMYLNWPNPEVVLPLPFPVMTRRMPWRVSRGEVEIPDPFGAASLADTPSTARAYHLGGGGVKRGGTLAVASIDTRRGDERYGRRQGF